MERKTAPITAEDLQYRDDSGTVDQQKTEMVRKLSSVLQNILINLTSDSAFLTVKNNRGLIGLESWRLLVEKYTLPRAQRAMTELMRVMHPKFGETTFVSDFEKWEAHLKEYEVQSAKELDDEIKITSLISGTSGKFQEHLRLQVGAVQTLSLIHI